MKGLVRKFKLIIDILYLPLVEGSDRGEGEPARTPANAHTPARAPPLKHSREGSARAFVHVRACARARVPGFIVISSIKASHNRDNKNKINHN